MIELMGRRISSKFNKRNTCCIKKKFWPHHAACRILAPQPGTEPRPWQWMCLSPNHWTTREFPFYWTRSLNEWWIKSSLQITHLRLFIRFFFVVALVLSNDALFQSTKLSDLEKLSIRWEDPLGGCICHADIHLDTQFIQFRFSRVPQTVFNKITCVRTSSIDGLNFARVAAQRPAKENSLAEMFCGQGGTFLSRKEIHESRPLLSISSTRRSR